MHQIILDRKVKDKKIEIEDKLRIALREGFISKKEYDTKVGILHNSTSAIEESIESNSNDLSHLELKLGIVHQIQEVKPLSVVSNQKVDKEEFVCFQNIHKSSIYRKRTCRTLSPWSRSSMRRRRRK